MIFTLSDARMIIARLFPTSYASVCTVENARMSERRPFVVGHGFLGFGVTGRADSLAPARAFHITITRTSLDSS